MPPWASTASAAPPSPGFLTHKTGVLQMLPDQVPDTRFIVNDQYFCHKDDLLIYLYL